MAKHDAENSKKKAEMDTEKDIRIQFNEDPRTVPRSRWSEWVEAAEMP